MELSKLMGCVKRPFIPSELFRDGLIGGAWFDPSDMSTLYQDAAGTIPVTAVEQPVGLMLDKSQGLMLRPELVVNGTFDTDASGWIASAAYSATITANNGACSFTSVNSSARIRPNGISTTIGNVYKVSIDILSLSTAVIVRASTESSQGVSGTSVGEKTVSTAGTYSFMFKATTATTYLWVINTGEIASVVTIDNVSVKEIYGNHATQSITASRPTLSARYNLLTKTEDFSDAVWTKANITNPTYPPVVTPDAAIGPDGITYADLVTPANIANSSFIEIYQNGTIISGLTYHQYYCVKPNGWRYLQSAGNGGVFGSGYVNFDLVTGTVTASVPGTGIFSGDITPLTDGWFLIHVSAAAIASGTAHLSINFIDGPAVSRGDIATGNGIDGVYVTRADLRVGGASAGPYQRVNTATDYDTDERYFPKYLRFDGVDDYLTLGDVFDIGINGVSINTSVILFESTKSPIAGKSRLGVEGGRYFLGAAPSSFLFATHGSETPMTIAYSQSIGESVVLSAKLGPHGNRSLSLYKNAALINSIGTDLTTSSYDTYNPFWIGAYPNSSGTTPAYGYLNGVIYGLIVTQSALTDAQRIQCERYLSRKAGVIL